MNNGRFRQNNNSIYSLNYKFDSVSAAGKFSGTALELIKKYNELAKEAHSNGDYVEMEVFRQYAEHYRKIVTEINERKSQSRDNQSAETSAEPNETTEQPVDNGLVETQSADAAETAKMKENAEGEAQTTVRRRRSFTIVEVTSKNADGNENAGEKNAENEAKPRRRVLKRKPTEEATA